MMTEPTSLVTAIGIAAAAGIVHTLVGPDHYVPLGAVARERRWSLGRASAVTAGFGLLHCLTSVVLVFAFAGAASALDLMASAAAWLMIGTGVCLAVFALRRARAGRAASGAAVPTMLGLAFLVGPCEWLIPVAGATLADAGPVAAVLVCAAYSLCTVLAMVAAVLVVSTGFRLVPQRSAGIVGGVACAVSGALMLVGF